MPVRRIRNFFSGLRDAFKLLSANDPLRLAGATAFFATFALPFILIILLYLLSFLFDQREISHDLFLRMSSVLGQDSVRQVLVTIRGFRGLVHGSWAIAGGSLFMIFVATTLFRVIRNSMDQLWMIRVTDPAAVKLDIITRFKSLLVILFTGVLFGAGAVLDGLQILFGNFLLEISPLISAFFKTFFSLLASVLVQTVWFGVVFRFIPDARPTWRMTFVGALLTAILYAFGKYVLKWILVDSNINTVFGTAGAFAILLLFVFYSSMIMYFGAAFTLVWSNHRNQPIVPRPYAGYFTMQDADCFESPEKATEEQHS